ncbi:MAG: hypothetical protein LBS59_05540 [Puniceicoccales bacterium]|jgi:methionyl-tRNA formyltransferase|nr:hypothetical protein [Puniceicoccales bacterium]
MKHLVFFGSDEIALPCLEHILAAHSTLFSLTAVFSQPDRPSGRGQKLLPNAIVSWAHRHSIPVFQPQRLDESTPDALRKLGCAAALVMAYGQLFKRPLLDTPPLGFFNLHASLLPLLRGASPIEGAIAGRFPATGVSLQRIIPRLDAGPIVDSEHIPLSPNETRASLREKIAAACLPLIDRALPRIAAADAPGAPQDETAATFTRKITREDSAADFHASAQDIAARVRALSPWPGVTFPWHNVLLKIGAATAEPFSENTPAAPPGTLLSADATGLRIATSDGTLRILELQRPAGKMLPTAAFLSGFPMQTGTVIESRPMPPLTRRSDDPPFTLSF